MRIHQLEISLRSHIRAFTCRRRSPILVEEFDVTPINVVVGLGFQKIEETDSKFQDVLSPASKIILRESIKGKGLAVQMLSRFEFLIARRIDFPIESPVLSILHFIFKENPWRVNRLKTTISRTSNFLWIMR